MNPSVNNLTSTVTAASMAAALMALVGPWYKTHYGTDLTLEQASAIVAILAAGLHGLVVLPTMVIGWVVEFRTALTPAPVSVKSVITAPSPTPAPKPVVPQPTPAPVATPAPTVAPNA